MTKLEAWKAWCESAGTPDLATEFTLEQSSHGKAFSFAWESGAEHKRERIIAANAPEIERINTYIKELEEAVAAERNKLAAWMMSQGYATGHGDSIEKLLEELEWQIEERIRNEREACAAVCDVLAVHPEYASDITKVAAQAIRARGNK
jgi:hypothetical protein